MVLQEHAIKKVAAVATCKVYTGTEEEIEAKILAAATTANVASKRQPATPPSLLMQGPGVINRFVGLFRMHLWQKIKKIEDMVKGIEQSCLDIIDQDEDDIPNPPSQRSKRSV
nr:A-agglutinin anchorage subunit-like [Tanacetum cinerariifolium]